MPKKRSKKGVSPDLGQTKSYEIHFFVPGSGFKAGFYSGESKEQALAQLKREYPKANAFWINLTRGKALAGPRAMRYLVWWKNYGGPDWIPHTVFVLDPEGHLVGSVPDMYEGVLKMAWDIAQRRAGANSKGHKLEFVDEATASLFGNEIDIQNDRTREDSLRDWKAGKFDHLEFEGPGLEGVGDVPRPDQSPRPEMWNLASVMQAVNEGYRFGLPFVMGESLFTPNAYWIGGRQYADSILWMGSEQTPDLKTLAGWLRVKLYFPPEMVPRLAWIGQPNENGVVAVFAEIDPATVDWVLLNRNF